MKLPVHLFGVALGAGLLSLAFPTTSAKAESYQDYLARLKAVCEVDCMQPRQFQRAARRRDHNESGEMAVIMDVVDVRRVGDRFELLSMSLRDSILVEREILASAGINTSGRDGIGGLPRGQQGGSHPNLIIIEIDEAALFEFLNQASPQVEGVIEARTDEGREEGIVVEGDRDAEFVEPSLTSLRTYFRNRRVVVRGKPRLEAVFIGARRDFRRKQVTLSVDRPEHIVLLPRYDEDGEPVMLDRMGE